MFTKYGNSVDYKKTAENKKKRLTPLRPEEYILGTSPVCKKYIFPFGSVAATAECSEAVISVLFQTEGISIYSKSCARFQRATPYIVFFQFEGLTNFFRPYKLFLKGVGGISMRVPRKTYQSLLKYLLRFAQ